MIGGSRFALARARAARAPLVTLAVVAALATALIAGVAVLVASVDAGEVRTALAGATGDRGRVVVTVDADASPEDVAAAIDAELAARGAGGALVASIDGGTVVLSPDLGRIDGSHAVALVEALPELRDAVDERAGTRVQVAGGLRDTLVTISAGVQARSGPTAVAVAMLGLISAVVVGAVALEAVRARETETRLLRARGVRRRQLFALAGVEAVVVAGLGAALGGGVTAVLARVLGGVQLPLLSGVAALAVAATAFLAAGVATVRGADRAASRGRAVADIGVVVVLAVVTGLALWRFSQDGTPVVARAGGTSILDPLVAIAPALGLALAAVIGVALATPIARVVAASLAPTRGVAPVTPLRLAARRPGRHALPVAVVAFAVGAVTVAVAYQGTMAALGDAPEALRVGADVRAMSIPDDVEAAAVAAAGDPDASMLVRPMSAKSSDGRVPVLAVDAAGLGDVMSDAGGSIDPWALGELLTPPPLGVPVGGSSLTITITAMPNDGIEFEGEASEEPDPAAVVVATLVSADGAVQRVESSNTDVSIREDGDVVFTEVDIREVSTETFDLGPGDWALAAVDARMHDSIWTYGSVRVDIAGAEPIDMSGFSAAFGTPGTVFADLTSLVFTPEVGENTTPSTHAVAPGVASSVPIVVTSDVADALSLDVGDSTAFDVSSPDVSLEAEVVGVVPVLPGTPSGRGILFDRTTVGVVTGVGIPANQAWLSTGDPGATAAAVADEFPDVVVAVADPRAAQSAAGTVLAFALAALGATALAIVVLFLRRTRSRADARELALLAVLGLGRRRAARTRAAEDLFAVALGVLAGVAAGLATAWLVVPTLVRAAYGTVPESYPVPLAMPWVLLGASVVVAALVFAAIIASVRAPAHLAALLREDE
ncbi:ABC-type antimicrobial peptide transport system permease subunit [Microbacterium terrae]|uniref:FtsX-like permease family protein n=1 Tax=Microbacterium terrae TaxID=69369 RepID=A0A0M2H5Y4_9MICO|nr:hypothetical protein [Microbacterium terrae]KJL39260.1 FtsX-like permease family protein [Microbacterium terrae]MBP1076806.1 ABC-type antimicrobial peptide transport system permease subunit [Microbacterium terrae]GLJ99400.1 hypothetical protein GCM10017594_25980 [Microbacterium terrae]